MKRKSLLSKEISSTMQMRIAKVPGKNSPSEVINPVSIHFLMIQILHRWLVSLKKKIWSKSPHLFARYAQCPPVILKIFQLIILFIQIYIYQILILIQRNERLKKQSSESMLGTPLPEDAEVPFISSLQGAKARSMSLHNKSSALESFMKFDRKYTRVRKCLIVR